MGDNTEVNGIDKSDPLWGSDNTIPIKGCDCDPCKQARIDAAQMIAPSMLPEQFKDSVFAPLPDLPKADALTKVPEGKKFDSGKSPVTRGVLWYFPRALLAVADVSAYGCKKYDLALENKNWMSVPGGQGRYADAEGRHLIKQAINPIDGESKLMHAQMDAWNSLAKLELLLIEEEKAGRVSYD